MIEIRDVAFAYRRGNFRLAIPAFDLKDGERVAVVGPSGSGKTTLLNIIAGISVPQRGSVSVDGVELSRMPDRSRRAFRSGRIGFVFQDFELIEYLSAGENILYPFRISDGLRLTAEVRARAKTLAEAAGIGDKLERWPSELSYGEQQRVAICRALAPRPRLVLADEATGNLDPETKVTILDLLFERVRAEGATLLCVTHDHELLPRFDRVIDFRQFRHVTAA